MLATAFSNLQNNLQQQLANRDSLKAQDIGYSEPTTDSGPGVIQLWGEV
jgi:hypothetical protein